MTNHLEPQDEERLFLIARGSYASPHSDLVQPSAGWWRGQRRSVDMPSDDINAGGRILPAVP